MPPSPFMPHHPRCSCRPAMTAHAVLPPPSTPLHRHRSNHATLTVHATRSLSSLMPHLTALHHATAHQHHTWHALLSGSLLVRFIYPVLLCINVLSKFSATASLTGHCAFLLLHRKTVCHSVHSHSDATTCDPQRRVHANSMQCQRLHALCG